MKLLKQKLFIGILLTAAGTTFAIEKKLPLQAKAVDKATIEQQIESVRKGMELGGRYQFVNDTERYQVNRALDEISRLFSNHVSIHEMNEEERVAIFNAQERANGILTKRDGERLICEHKPMIGSNKKQTVCQTYADQQLWKRNSQSQMRKFQQSPPLKVE